MKTKSKEVKKKKGKINIIENKAIDEHGYPIKRSEVCFHCGERFFLTFVSLKQHYAFRNFWFYGTERGEDKEKFIDNFCLRKIFLEEKDFYLKNIGNIRKKKMLSSYCSSNSI